MQKAEQEKERLRREQEFDLQKVEFERERTKKYNRAYRKAHLAETAARQRRWRAKKKVLAEPSQS